MQFYYRVVLFYFIAELVILQVRPAFNEGKRMLL